MPVSSYDDNQYTYDNLGQYYNGSVVVPTDAEAQLRLPPSLTGLMSEAPAYQFLGFGLTDRIFLLGHSAGVLYRFGSPSQVVNLQESIDALDANPDSPLLAALLQSYKAGARDIYIYSVAPQVEYVESQADRLKVSTEVDGKTCTEMSASYSYFTLPDGYTESEWDDLTFYERYKVRLDVAYSILEEWDSPQIIVPLEAPFYYAGGVDFLTPLANHCQAAFENTGAVRIGMLGSKTITGTFGLDDYEEMLYDERLEDLGAGAKFVSVYAGECLVQYKESTTTRASSPVHIIASILASLPINNSVAYKKLPNVYSMVGGGFTSLEIKQLSKVGVNCLTRTTLGKRGRPFEVVSATDNTLALLGSDFWAVGHMRMIMLLVEQLRSMGRRYLGTVGFGQFREEVHKFLSNLVSDGMIRNYTASIERSATDQTRATVDVAVSPFFGVRQVFFQAEVGPNL